MGFIRGRSIEDIATPALTKHVYAPISPQQGKFIYQTARAIGAKRIVEFGTSFGISTIYLAAAVKDNLGEIVISTEMEPYKHEHAIRNLTEAGLDDVTDIRSVMRSKPLRRHRSRLIWSFSMVGKTYTCRSLKY